MKKTINFLLFSFIFLFLTLAVFAQNSVVSVNVRIGGQDYTFNNGTDVTAQIELREAKIAGNNSEIKYISLMRVRVIERNDLSIWGRLFNEEVQEFNRQIKVLEDLNKRLRGEISQLNRVLRKFRRN